MERGCITASALLAPDMSAVTRLTPPPQVSDYAPGAASLHVSEVTVEAIDKIGDATATQMEKAAEALEARASERAGKILGDAKEAADELREAAKRHRAVTRAMAQQVSDFCLQMSSARSTVRGLEGQVKDKIVRPVPTEHDDGEPSPAFLHTTDAGGKPNGRHAD
jgi:hypothetical protein